MSGIGGWLARGGPGSDERISVLAGGLAWLGPDRSEVVRDGPVALVFHSFDTTGDSPRQSQPFALNQTLTTFDGRLDNRAELARQLDVSNDRTDVELTARAYVRWGSECFVRLVGDFAVAVWDARTQTVLLARDPLGVGRLFYHLTSDKCLVWASVPEAIAACPGVPSEPNLEYVAGFLAGFPEICDSPFRSIYAVAPGSLVASKNGTVLTSSFWNVRTFRPADVPRKSSGDYAAEFRGLFTQAVRGRLRGTRPALAHLSGGLDSSSVVCVADEILRGNTTRLVPRVDTLTLGASSSKGMETDLRMVETVERQRGRAGIHVDIENDPILGDWPDVDFVSFPRMEFCSGGIRGVLDIARRGEHRILLTGLFGDELLRFWFAPREVARLVRSGRVASAVRLAYTNSRSGGRPALQLLWRCGIKAQLPPWLQRQTVASVPEWVSPALVKQTGLIGRLREKEYAWGIGSVQSGVYRFPFFLGQLERFAAWGSHLPTHDSRIEARHPFLDRPLVEFLMSLPVDEIVSIRHETRMIQRAAMVGILPEPIRTRNDKGDVSDLIVSAVKRRWRWIDDLLRNSVAVRSGYVEPVPLRIMCERIKHGMLPTTAELQTFIAIEMWARAFERQRWMVAA